MSLRERVISNLIKRRDNLLSGGINSIPSPFERFSSDFIGVEQGKYYVVTSSTKGAKTQFASYVFLFNTILYAYYNPELVKVKIFYYPLEETQENVMERFMSHILYVMSSGKIRVAPIDLKSSNNKKPLSDETLELLESKEFQEIFDFFESCIVFSNSTNPTGVYRECKKYAEENGVVHTKKQKVKDQVTGEVSEINTFDHYESNNPKEYRIIFWDHVSLTSTERGLTLKQTIDKLSEYFVILRNRYQFSIVAIQQQAFAGESIEAFKENKIRPTVGNLSDSKYPSRDANIVLGLFSPFKHDLKDYYDYDITKFRDNIRFLEVLVNRDGVSGGLIALFFDGAVNEFRELPLPDNKEAMSSIYSFLDRLRGKSGTLFFTHTRKKIRNLLLRWK